MLLRSEFQEHKREYRLGNRQSNAHIVKSKGHKLYVPDFITTISFYNFKNKEMLFRKSLPISQCPNHYLQDIIAKKYVSWHFAAESFRVGGPNGFSALKMQRFPFLIIDVDNVDVAEVASKIAEWEHASLCSFFPSISKKGVHIHFRLDLSDLPPEFKTPTRFDATTQFKKTLRFEILHAVAVYLWDSLEQIGITPDRKVIDRIVANPPEISFINEVWARRQPVHYSRFVELEKKIAKTNKLNNSEQLKKVKVFVNKLVDFAKKPEACNAVCDWVEGSVSHKRVKTALKFIVNNYESIQATMLNNFEHLSILMSKKVEVGIGVDMAVEKIFGSEAEAHKSYLRAILVYAFSLKKAKEHIPNHTVTLYEYKRRFEGSFDHFWLSKNWHVQSGKTHIQPGNGNTFKYLQVAIPNMLKTLTPDQVMDRLEKELDKPEINDKTKRLRDAQSYIRHLTTTGGQGV